MKVSDASFHELRNYSEAILGFKSSRHTFDRRFIEEILDRVATRGEAGLDGICSVLTNWTPEERELFFGIIDNPGTKRKAKPQRKFSKAERRKAIERVGKLFALANDRGAFVAEAKVAITKAKRIMLIYGIKDSDILAYQKRK